jgi:TatD DNase family protein
MLLIDSHCHIHDPEYNFDVEKTLKKAAENEVKKIITVGTSPQDNLAAKALAEKYDNVFYSFGFHPSELASGWEEESDLSSSKLIAIGEIGLDYHYKPYDRAKQIKLFEQMLEIAQEANLPIIFHVREAFDDFLAVLKNFPRIKNAVVHSFSDSAQNLKKLLETTDFYIGVNGLATFTNIPLPPLERMLLETDAPFLTPVPFRGKINEPAYIRSIASFVANKSSLSVEEVARITTNNVKNLFGI